MVTCETKPSAFIMQNRDAFGAGTTSIFLPNMGWLFDFRTSIVMWLRNMLMIRVIEIFFVITHNRRRKTVHIICTFSCFIISKYISNLKHLILNLALGLSVKWTLST